MRVQFLVDYRGKLTQENYYTAGAVVEFDAGTAQALVDEGRAEMLPALVPAPEITPALPKPAQRKAKQGSGGGVL